VTTAPANSPPVQPELPRLTLDRLHRSPWALWVAFGVLLAAGAAWAVWATRPAHDSGPAALDEDLFLCQRFARMKEDRDPAADEMLAPAPAVSEDPVTPEEADRIDAATFLRADLSVRYVRADRSANDASRFVLVTKGAGAGPVLYVRSGGKVGRTQKVMTNPEVVVEVRDGKIYPIRARISLD
jgi:hypothetical protein